MTSQPTILVAGIGNIFLGDDAFGVEVVRRLQQRRMPEHVRVVDFGIRGMDLAYALMDGYELAILVDAAPRGASPGTVYVLELDANTPIDAADSPDGHGMDPVRVLDLVRTMGTCCKRFVLVGCEPARFEFREDEDLSPEVESSIDTAITLIEEMTGATMAKGEK
jgi:hydrogenase maturation protease